MTVKTCAACNCQQGARAIKVKIGGRVADVCRDECAKPDEAGSIVKAMP